LEESTKYLLIGGGVASVTAAQGIRQRDKAGRLMIVTANTQMPYDRPPLSKNFLSNNEMSHDDVSSKYDVWYTDNAVEVKLGAKVKGVDRRAHVAILEDGSKVKYEKLLFATGSRPNKLKGPHLDSDTALTLRTIEDATRLRQAMQSAKKAVIIGTGFLGTEVAAQCAEKGIETTIVSPAQHIWDRFASPALGEFMNAYYRGRGVQLGLGEHVGVVQDDRVIAGNMTIPTDFTLQAIGVTLNTELAENAGVAFLPDEGIKVDNHFRSFDDPDIFAAGDVAFFQDFATDRYIHYEHHLSARWTGEVAGANMAGDPVAYDKVPYFFSDFFDLHMVLRGQAPDNNYTTVLGTYDSGEFIELYADEGGFLRMGIAISREEPKLDPISDKLEELVRKHVQVKTLSMADFA